MDINLHKILKAQKQRILLDIRLNIHYVFSLWMNNSKLNIFGHIFVLDHQQNFRLWL